MPGSFDLRTSYRNALTTICLMFVLGGFALLASCGGVTRTAAGPPSGSATGGSPGAGGGGGSGGGGGGGTNTGAPGGNSGGAPGASSGTSNAAFVYVVDAAPNVIETYKMDTASGALTLAGQPYQTGHGLATLALTPNGKFGYGVANDFINNVFTNFLLVFTFNSSGLPTLHQTIDLGTGITGSPAVDPSGRFVFVTVASNNNTGSGILSYSIQNDGSLVQNGVIVPTDVNPGHIVIDVLGRFLYTDTESTNKIWGFSINSTTGTLTEVPNTPFVIQRTVPQAGKEPTDFNEVLDPAGQRLFVVDNINSQINVFSVDQSTGGIMFQGSTRSLQFEELFAPAMDPKGRFLYIAEFNTNAITGFGISNTTITNFPQLAGMPVTTSGAPNRWMVVDPTGAFAYSIEVDAIGDLGTLDGYQIDQGSGTLIRLNSTPLRLQGSPVWIAIGTQ